MGLFDDLPDEQDIFYDDEELTPEAKAELLANKELERCAPIEYKMKPTKKIIAVVDTETDPFEENLIVKPFSLGFLTPDRYVDFWGDDCVKQFFEYLETQDDEYIIYAHNGGKFDFFFFLNYLDKGQSPLIMNGRLVKIFMQGQEFRDSYSIIPQALGSYQKDKIDYNKFKRNCREKHKAEILKYQKSDCVYLRELITGFHDMFGDKLTIASASLPMLNNYHGFERIGGDGFDERFRQYYYGGRNQCFETGILKSNWIIVDRNSMYSASMKEAKHPISNQPRLQREIDDDTDFACIVANNHGALPTRREDNSLDFTVKEGTFFATIHEINAGIETGTLEIKRVKHAWAFDRKTTFDDFVDRFYSLKTKEGQPGGDRVKYMLYKFCLNSGYGKFAINPRKFKQWTLTDGEVPEPQATDDMPDGWSLHSQCGNLFIWSRPNPRKSGFINVATAASITGAARANLLRNLSLARRPIYCDTDSIICEHFSGDLDETKLGGWKIEGRGTLAAIGGKKLYAIFDGEEAIKIASKGVRLDANEILSVCNGNEVVFRNPVPNFNLDGSADFTERRIKMTGGE